MKQVTVSEFRLDTGKTYNEVQVSGRVGIVHRDRPPMILATEEFLDKEFDKAFKRGAASTK